MSSAAPAAPNPPIIAPSILASDFGRLADEVADISAAEWVHVDVMDGHFVPNITIGPPVVKAVRAATDKFVDVHLMIDPIDPFLEAFAKAGADQLTVHVEAATHLDRTLSAIRELGVKAGVSLNPATPAATVQHVLDKVDLILAMTVNPGFGGQKYISTVEPKIAELREMIGDRDIRLQVDGGIDVDTAPLVVAAGADVLVAGSAVYGKPDRNAAIEAIRAAATR
ncbi:MAG: ribulose-phosphate 3-epimerase [Acidimicrobiales bacterium]